MRALVQRVTEASVVVDGDVVAAIGPGLLILLGVARTDDEDVCDRVADKVASLRIFAGPDGRMEEALADGGREALCVSQFTLYGDVRRGTRPSWSAAADGATAEPLYDRFCRRLGARRGVFGADMAVRSVNDGPVTLLVEREATV
ncbi:MAG: D-aminoacyl-tRNA deacylase [Solirubrobacteraceae bacterium]|nr:D-aminoacyl-tRNA deacylase [Solirubrobacteraceae bacterium]